MVNPGTGLSRKSKDWTVDAIRARMHDASNLIVTQFEKLSPGASGNLRAKLDGVDARYLVTKRKLALQALQGTNFSPASTWVDGPTALVLTGADPVAVAKTLTDFMKENEHIFTLKGGIIEGQALEADRLHMLAKIPSRHVLLTQVVSGMNAPIQGFAGALRGIVQQIVTVIGQIHTAKREEGSS